VHISSSSSRTSITVIVNCVDFEAFIRTHILRLHPSILGNQSKPSTMPSQSGHRHSHTHRDDKEKKGDASAQKEKPEWFWLCCWCKQHLQSQFIEACPEFNCGHTRCTTCTWEERKVRKAA
jgi:hypothetical protein